MKALFVVATFRAQDNANHSSLHRRAVFLLVATVR